MTMKECYLDAISWLGKHPSNRIIIRVKTDKELEQYQKYFKTEMTSDLFADPKLYDIIEWKVDPLIEK
jgi:hypothetical protein